MSVIEVKVPDIGDYKNVPVVEIFVSIGEQIAKEQSLLSLESDKAMIDIPAPFAGIVKQISVATGDSVSEGSLLLVMEAAEEAVASPAAVASSEAEPNREKVVTAQAEPRSVPIVAAQAVISAAAVASPGQYDAAPIGGGHAGPSVRKLARQLGVAIAQLTGSGLKGRITQDDVKAYVKKALSGGGSPAAAGNGGELNLLAWPKVDFAKFGPVTSQPLSRIKKISGANLHRNWVKIPHVTNHDDVDVTELEALRVDLNKEYAKSGDKVTLLAFLLKASAVLLQQFPNFNASLEGDQLVLKQYVHIGFAADTPSGLVVPVIRDVDQKGIIAISREMTALSALAREGKLKPDQMQGGCFSISSLGGIGGTYFTPIINAPEVAILGVGRASLKPVWDTADGGRCVPRLIMPLSLSWDHRVVDGAEAGRFLALLNKILADFRRVSL